jgi:hypothetical protein
MMRPRLHRVAVLRGWLRGVAVDIEYTEHAGTYGDPVIIHSESRKRLDWTLTAAEQEQLTEIVCAP